MTHSYTTSGLKARRRGDVVRAFTTYLPQTVALIRLRHLCGPCCSSALCPDADAARRDDCRCALCRLSFDIRERNFLVHVEVYDYDRFGMNDSLGQIIFNVPNHNRVLPMGAWTLQTNPRSPKPAQGTICYEYIVQYRPDIEWSTCFTGDLQALKVLSPTQGSEGLGRASLGALWKAGSCRAWWAQQHGPRGRCKVSLQTAGAPLPHLQPLFHCVSPSRLTHSLKWLSASRSCQP